MHSFTFSMTAIKNILTITFIIGIFALHPSLNKGETPITYLQYLVYGNMVNLSYDSSIDKSNINIEWECEDQNYDCMELTIVKNGEQVNEIPFEKGNQKLVVYYNNKVIGTLHQNKAVKAQSHKYNIELKADHELLSFKGEIIGPSPAVCSNTMEKSALTFADL